MASILRVRPRAPSIALVLKNQHDSNHVPLQREVFEQQTALEQLRS